MRVVVQDTLKNQQWVGYEGPAGFLVGRDEACGVSLPSSRFVSRRHCQVDRGEHGWEVQVLEPATAVTVDGKVLQPGRTATLRPVSQIRLAEFVLTLLQAEQDVISEEEAAFEDVDALQRDLHAEVLRRLELRRAGSEHLEPTEQHLDQINTIIDDLLQKVWYRIMPHDGDTVALVEYALNVAMRGVFCRVWLPEARGWWGIVCTPLRQRYV